jgi:radical SAM protein with 4Fe4S-binding SPASM domain
MGRYMKDFRFGKLGQDSLTDVWMNHPTLAVIREGIPKRLQGICARCVLRSACLGHCRLENENVTLEHFFDPYPKCVSAEELGLFPASRLISQPKLETPAAV